MRRGVQWLGPLGSSFFFFKIFKRFLKDFFKDFIYLFIEREGQRHRQREKQAPCREPDVGLDPRSPGSHPRLQAAPNRCATRAARPLSSLESPSLTGVALGEPHWLLYH